MEIGFLGDIIYILFIFLLIILFFVSLIFYIKGKTRNQKIIAHRSSEIEGKLDRIIELLEENNKQK